MAPLTQVSRIDDEVVAERLWASSDRYHRVVAAVPVSPRRPPSIALLPHT